MNASQVNEFRVAHGLAPIVPDEKAKRMQAQRQASNKAAHAQLQRDIKALRNKGGKAK
jgi:hypothetical protein